MNTGVRVLRFDPVTGANVLLVSPGAQPDAFADPILRAGQKFTSYDGGVRITIVSADDAKAVVSINVTVKHQ